MNASGYPSPLWRLVAVTWELDDRSRWVPVVRHEFYGATPERTIQVFEAHLKSDAFLRDCQSGRFGAVRCHTQLGTPELVG